MMMNRVSNSNIEWAILATILLMAAGCSGEDAPSDDGGRVADSPKDKSAGKDDTKPSAKDNVQQEVADTVYTNGKIYTVSSSHPHAVTSGTGSPAHR